MILSSVGQEYQMSCPHALQARTPHIQSRSRSSGRATPAKDIFVQTDANDLVQGEVAVFDALLKAVGIDGLAEVVGIGNPHSRAKLLPRSSTSHDL